MKPPKLVRSLPRTARVVLTRHLKSGATSVIQDLAPGKALMFAGMMLHDNANVSQQDAQEWANALPLGIQVTHLSGYGVTIEKT